MRGFEFLVPFTEKAAEAARFEAAVARKKLAWERRKKLIPAEVLKCSSATDAEKAFLFGQSDHDPDPTGGIEYEELWPGREVLDIPEVMVTREPLVPPTRDIPRERKSLRREIIDAVLLRPLPSPNLEQSGTHWRQAGFHAEIDLAIAAATLDMSYDERDALYGIRDYDGTPVQDPNPFEFVEYHALAPRGEVVYKAE